MNILSGLWILKRRLPLYELLTHCLGLGIDMTAIYAATAKLVLVSHKAV